MFYNFDISENMPDTNFLNLIVEYNNDNTILILILIVTLAIILKNL